MFDPNELAPGIRALVLELRAHGFATCDSGDGTGQMEGALPFRHVFSTCPVDLMIAEAERMTRIYPDSRVELLWSPNEAAMIALYPDQNADGTENRPRTWAGTPDFLKDAEPAMIALYPDQDVDGTEKSPSTGRLCKRSDLYDVVILSETRAEVRCRGGLRLLWATLELVRISGWVVRRLDWLDPSPHRMPTSRPAVTSMDIWFLLETLATLPRTTGADQPEPFDHRKHYDEDNRFNDCRAGRDGDCTWTECPQERDNEPKKTGRHCPLDTSE